MPHIRSGEGLQVAGSPLLNLYQSQPHLPMNLKLLSILTTLAAIITGLAGLDLSGIASLIPGDHAGTVAWISGSLTTLLIIIRALGDLLDDGKPNGSFRCPGPIFISALLLSLLALTSCGTPVAIRLQDLDRGIGASYSSKGGLGLDYTRPVLSDK